MKKILLVFALILNPIMYSSAQFSDLSPNEDYYDAIMYMQRENIINGYPDGTFRPLNTVNRVEFLKMIQPEGKNAGKCYTSFADANTKTAWYGSYVCLAMQRGLIKGYPDGTLRPSSPISLAEAAKIIVLSQNIAHKTEKEWFAGYINALQAKNAIPKSVKSPSQLLKRHEVAQMMYNVLQRAEKNEEIVYNDGAYFAEKAVAPTNKELVVLFDKMNALRVQQGLQKLIYDAELEEISQEYAEYMAKYKQFSHYTLDGRDLEDRFAEKGTKYGYYGENLAKGQVDGATTYKSWLNSPPHYQNLINEHFTHVGLGIAKVQQSERGYEKGYYWAFTATSK